MSEYRLSERRLPAQDHWDVIVAGGGPSGCAAAVAAAREGARTLLIEATGCLGGMGTAGLVPAWCPFSDQEKMIYRGFAERVFTEALNGVPHARPGALDWVPINPEYLKRVYDHLVLDAGVKVLFHTIVAGVEMAAPDRIDALICANKSGLTAQKAKIYVDCTGDGDVAAWAGAKFEKGDPVTGETQPASHCFILSNVNSLNYQCGRPLYAGSPNSLIWQILVSGKYPLIADEHMCTNLIGPDTVGFNAGHLWDADPTNPEQISAAMSRGRLIADEIRRALADHHPQAFGGAFVAATAPLMGVRENRRIIGDHILSIDDYFARRRFADEIAVNCYFIDIHTSKAEVAQVRREQRQSVASRYENYAKGEAHGIPYRCLTPKGLANVLVAGRCISCDRPVQGSIRVMPTCLVTGEAAGVGAARAAQVPAPDVHRVDVAVVRQRLREQGAYLPIAATDAEPGTMQ